MKYCGWLIYMGGLYFTEEKGVNEGRGKKRDKVGGGTGRTRGMEGKL